MLFETAEQGFTVTINGLLHKCAYLDYLVKARVIKDLGRKTA